MPGYVNIGAWVGRAARWSTRGPRSARARRSARTCTSSGGVGIGGVLEPPQAAPVIVEDDAFIGSRAVIVEGVRDRRAGRRARRRTSCSPRSMPDHRRDRRRAGRVPRRACRPRAVVIPGTRPKEFPAGSYGLPCALIIGERSASTDLKTSLNDVLREFEIAV